MKKHMMIILCMFIVAGIVLGCSPSCVYAFSQPIEQIENIQIVNVTPFYNIRGNDLEVQRIIMQIDPAKHQGFIDDFLALSCFRYVGDRLEYIGDEAIRIIYKDGAFEWIDADTVYYESADDNWNILSYHFEESEFEKFIKDAILTAADDSES